MQWSPTNPGLKSETWATRFGSEDDKKSPLNETILQDQRAGLAGAVTTSVKTVDAV